MSSNDSQINNQDQPQPGVHGHTTEFFVDGEAQFTSEHTLTVAQILNLVGLDPATHFLVELQGNHQAEHRDAGEEIHIHEKQKFITVFTGETPVS
jgi:hypothetical protein